MFAPLAEWGNNPVSAVSARMTRHLEVTRGGLPSGDVKWTSRAVEFVGDLFRREYLRTTAEDREELPVKTPLSKTKD
jgi:hypothetical protein